MGVINHILLHFYDVSVAAAATRCAIGEKNHQKSFFLLDSLPSSLFLSPEYI